MTLDGKPLRCAAGPRWRSDEPLPSSNPDNHPAFNSLAFALPAMVWQ